MKLTRDPQRLLPSDSTERKIATELYDSIKGLPIISPHGHVEAELLAKNENFSNPSDLFIKPDHYLTRVLNGAGIDLALLGVNRQDYDSRLAWRLLCSNWNLFVGTPTQYWLEDQLSQIFGIQEVPDSTNSDHIYDQITEKLADRRFRPRELVKSFNISLLATTDGPDSSLEWHMQLHQDESFATRVIPTFRPDAFSNIDSPSWVGSLEKLGQVTNSKIQSFEALISALSKRREFFRELNATSTDSGALEAKADRLEPEQAEALFQVGLRGNAKTEEADLFRAHFLYWMIKMASEDGMVMQLHAGVVRNHHGPTYSRFGPDSGHDLPAPVNFSFGLKKALNDFGIGTELRLVLFSVDESSYARDIAPLAGFYPSVFLGAPWWFLDHPHQIESVRKSTTAHTGFYKTSGFIDDTRALCSIPSRHDMSRRVDCSVLAEMVAKHSISMDQAQLVAMDLVTKIPTETFRLGKLISQEPLLGERKTPQKHNSS